MLNNIIKIFSIVVLLNGFASSAVAYTYSFDTYDVPGYYNTSIKGINDAGVFVGETRPTSLTYSDAFLYDGAYQYIDPSGLGDTGVEAWDVNNAGTVIGGYKTVDGLRGFLYDGNAYTTLNHTGANATELFDINNSDIVAGGYWDYSWNNHAFLYDMSNDSYAYYDVPNSVYTTILGLSDYDLFVGEYMDSNNNSHGFLYDNGSYITLDVPGATWTSAADINNDGIIVGTYTDAGGLNHGFLYDGISYSTIDMPGSSWTEINSISNNYAIAGEYGTTSDPWYHTGIVGMLDSTPVIPEPISAILFIAGGAVLGIRRYFKN